MDSMEINKIVGAAVGALLIYLGANFFAELYYVGTGHGEHEYAYSIETTDEAGGGEEAEEEVDFAELMANADPSRGEREFGKCRACHKLEAGATGVGPSLHQVVGRPIAAEDGFAYSDALVGLEGDWTPEKLSAFLENPRGYAPGTKMSFAGLRDAEARANLIAYLDSAAE